MRLIRGDEEPKKEKEDSDVPVTTNYMLRVIGYEMIRGVMIVEDPYTLKRYGVYMSTGAIYEIKDNRCNIIEMKNVPDGEDDHGRSKIKIQETLVKIEKYVDPPEPKHSSHSDTCDCNICHPYREWERKTGKKSAPARKEDVIGPANLGIPEEVLSATGISVRRVIAQPNTDRELNDYPYDDIPF